MTGSELNTFNPSPSPTSNILNPPFHLPHPASHKQDALPQSPRCHGQSGLGRDDPPQSRAGDGSPRRRPGPPRHHHHPLPTRDHAQRPQLRMQLHVHVALQRRAAGPLQLHRLPRLRRAALKPDGHRVELPSDGRLVGRRPQRRDCQAQVVLLRPRHRRREGDQGLQLHLHWQRHRHADLFDRAGGHPDACLVHFHLVHHHGYLHLYPHSWARADWCRCWRRCGGQFWEPRYGACLGRCWDCGSAGSRCFALSMSGIWRTYR